MYRRLLVTLDGSELARTALPAVVEASDADTEIHVLHVIPTRQALRRDITGSAYTFTGGDPEAIDDLAAGAHFRRRGEAQRELESAAAYLAEHGRLSVVEHVAEGDPANEILDYAEQVGCQAVVIASRGHGGLGREVLGSVAEYVVRHAGPMAVVVVGSRAGRRGRAG